MDTYKINNAHDSDDEDDFIDDSDGAYLLFDIESSQEINFDYLEDHDSPSLGLYEGIAEELPWEDEDGPLEGPAHSGNEDEDGEYDGR